VVPAADTNDLVRVGGTTAGGYFELGEDVLIAVPQPGYEQTEARARESLTELTRIIRDRGRKQALVVVVDNVQSQDAGSRRVWQRELDPTILCGLALVCESLLARAIGSFFIGLRRPVVPTCLVPNIEDGLIWTETQLRRDGGPLQG
jgi:hypothetical protein